MLSLLLAVPSCIYSFWHGVIPTSYFDFYTCFTIFYSGLALTVVCGEMIFIHVPVLVCAATGTYNVRTCVLCVRIKTEVVMCTCNQDKMASV